MAEIAWFLADSSIFRALALCGFGFHLGYGAFQILRLSYAACLKAAARPPHSKLRLQLGADRVVAVISVQLGIALV